jgi:O-antigen biosynthesis protein
MSENAYSAEAPIAYVLGVPRSGTTLLTHLLAQHPAIVCPSEPWLMLALDAFGSVPATHPCDPELIRLATGHFLGQSRAEILGRAAQTIYRLLLARSGKQMMIDKTPRYYHCLPFIREAIPQAKFVWIRRNPFDVVASHKVTWNIDIASLFGECRDVSQFFDFVLGFRQLADFADANDVCIISYEDLVKHPQLELERVFRHLGIPSYEVKEFDPTSGAHQPGQFGDQKIFQTRSVHQTSIGSYRSILSHVDLESVMRGLGRDLFSRLGYGREYDLAVREVSTLVVDRSETTYREALHLLSRRGAWAQGDPSDWYGQIQQNEVLKQQIKVLTNSLRKAEADRVALTSSVGELEADRAALTLSLKAAEADRVALTNSVGELGADQAALTHSLKSAEADRAALTGSLEAAEADRAALTHSLDAAEADRAALASALKEAEADRATLRCSLQKVGHERDSAIAWREAILASRSWRITAPFRKVRTNLSRSSS